MSRKILRCMAAYFLLSRSSRSGISCAARRRMSKAALVRRSTRSVDTACPDSASSSTLTMLPRSPLARRAQWESTERCSRRDMSRRRSCRWSGCAEFTSVLYRFSRGLWSPCRSNHAGVPDVRPQPRCQGHPRRCGRRLHGQAGGGVRPGAEAQDHRQGIR